MTALAARGRPTERRPRQRVEIGDGGVEAGDVDDVQSARDGGGEGVDAAAKTPIVASDEPAAASEEVSEEAARRGGGGRHPTDDARGRG